MRKFYSKSLKTGKKTQVYIISECIKRKYKTWENNQQFTCNKMDDSYKHDIKWKKKKKQKKHVVWLHWCGILKKTTIKGQKIYQWLTGRRGRSWSTAKWHKRTLGWWMEVLMSWFGSSYTNVCLCQKSWILLYWVIF